ncbi:MAG: IclR family transcriptional regulator [Candidatus Aminicenantes bacterium]|nr:IclR family transcriptional regulator [Candidatus Aminicenantes bacterium]
MSKQQNHYFSASVDKGFRIMNLFNQDCKKMSLMDIARALDIGKVTAFRYVNTLIELGYLRREPRTKLLKPGPSAITLSNNLMKSFDLLEIIRPPIDDVHNRYNVSIDSALFEGNALLKLYQRVVKEKIMYDLPIVETGLHCTALGKAVLAFLPDLEMQRLVDSLSLIKRSKKTLVTMTALLKDLAKTRDRGYSLNDEEYIIGLIAIGAPLIDSETKRPIGAVSFTFSSAEYSIKIMEKKYARILMDLAEKISATIPIG